MVALGDELSFSPVCFWWHYRHYTQTLPNTLSSSEVVAAFFLSFLCASTAAISSGTPQAPLTLVCCLCFAKVAGERCPIREAYLVAHTSSPFFSAVLCAHQAHLAVHCRVDVTMKATGGSGGVSCSAFNCLVFCHIIYYFVCQLALSICLCYLYLSLFAHLPLLLSLPFL